MKHIQTFESFLNEGTDYAVMLTGGSIGDKSRPRDAKGYVGMEVGKDEFLTSLDDAKAKAKRMNANLSPGEKSHYGLKYVVVPVKDGKFIKESVNEGNNLEYWTWYEFDTSVQGGPKEMTVKCTTMPTVLKCIDNTINLWNEESEEGELSKGDEKWIRELAIQFYKKFGYINGNIISAMIMQET